MKTTSIFLAALMVVLVFAVSSVFAGVFDNYRGEAGITAPLERDPAALYNFGSRGLPESKAVLSGEARIIGPNERPAEGRVVLEVPFGSYWGEAGITGPVDHIRLTP